MSNKPPFIIRLGPFWSAFSRPRTDLQLLGTIQLNASIGALARRPDGRYLQVNGDVESELNTSRVEATLRSLKSAPQQRRPARPKPSFDHASGPTTYSVPRTPATPPIVTVIKRRRIVVASDQ